MNLCLVWSKCMEWVKEKVSLLPSHLLHFLMKLPLDLVRISEYLQQTKLEIIYVEILGFFCLNKNVCLCADMSVYNEYVKLLNVKEMEEVSG